MTNAASFFLVLVAKILSRGGSAAAVWASHIIWYPTAAWGYTCSNSLSKSGGFINLALENKSKGSGLLDKVPFEWRSSVAQCWQPNLRIAITTAGQRGIRRRAGC
jgi:hypothetical protein